MNCNFIVLLAACILSWAVFPVASVHADDTGQGEHQALWHFDSDAPGTLPEGWRVDGTGQEGPLATWAVVDDATAPSGGQALALTAPNHASSPTFNLCWTRSGTFYDGALSVRFKANTGAVDQGGGLTWRVQDHNDYYVCRMNPLEDNFRLYVVHEGKRRQLASADVKVPAGTWHDMRVIQKGAHIECSLDGKKLLEADDNTIQREGGIGLWTKADAATSFDDLAVTIDRAKAPGKASEPKKKERHGTRYMEGS